MEIVVIGFRSGATIKLEVDNSAGFTKDISDTLTKAAARHIGRYGGVMLNYNDIEYVVPQAALDVVASKSKAA